MPWTFWYIFKEERWQANQLWHDFSWHFPFRLSRNFPPFLFCLFFCYWCFIVDWHSVFSFILLIFTIHASLSVGAGSFVSSSSFLFSLSLTYLPSSLIKIYLLFCTNVIFYAGLFCFDSIASYVYSKLLRTFHLLHFHCQKFILNEY